MNGYNSDSSMDPKFIKWQRKTGESHGYFQLPYPAFTEFLFSTLWLAAIP